MLETIKECRTCGKPFTDVAGRVGRPRIYCSGMCRGQWYVKQRIGYSLHDISEAHGWTCYLCNEPVDRDATGDQRPETDHIVPVYLGGTNAMNNLRVVHAICNKRKGQTIQCPKCGERFGHS